MEISFIIPCFNCKETVEETINSIFLGNIEKQDEIILIDDGSTDDTFQFLEKLVKSFPQIRLYKHNINKGSAAAARNTGIDLSRNNVLFTLDSDNVLQKDSIPLLKSFMLENRVDVVNFGEIKYFKTTTNDITHSWIMLKECDFYDLINFPFNTPGGSGNYMFTKESWKRAGRYNEFVGGALDSLVFSISLAATGSQFKTLENSFYYHRYGYDSTYVREISKENKSLLMLRALIPYLQLLDPNDCEYIFSKKNRLTWYDDITVKPLRKFEKNSIKKLTDFFRKIDFKSKSLK